MHARTIFALAAIAAAGCASSATSGTAARRTALDATPAVDLLQASRFDEAAAKAAELLAADPDNTVARAVAALTLYKKTMHDLVADLMTLGMSAARGSLNHRYARWTLEETDRALAEVDAHLEVAARDPGFALRQNLSAWRADWNHDGRINWRDETLFQIEVDADGREIPEDDPRRTPTFRFDQGDLYWARAMVAFQRVPVNLILAYKFTELDALLRDLDNRRAEETVITIRIDSRDRVHRARDLLRTGFAHADQARRLYLAETDDEGEWLPNPRQRNHPLPLPVDEALYQTWAGVLSDLDALIAGKEGLDIAELAQLGDHQWQDPPRGYLNLGTLLDEPGDIILDGKHLAELDRDRTRQDIERVLRDVFGRGYVAQMKPTGLIQRLRRMRQEIDRGEESLERKLRYLFWLN